jgi:hypothetical protein
LKVWPGLVDIIPEAKLNLAIFYLKNDDYVSAFNLLSDLEPSTPPVSIVLVHSLGIHPERHCQCVCWTVTRL